MRKIILIIVLASITASAVYAAPAEIPKSGQVTSYETGTTDDGGLQAGVAWPVPRFTPASSGTGTAVTDNLTGLIWSGYGGTPTFAGTTTCIGGAMAWQSALDYVACLNANHYLGHTDWRLPNILELVSLVHAEYRRETTCGGSCSTNADWLNTQGFSNVFPLTYWTSTTAAGDATMAFYVFMAEGFVTYTTKTGSYYVWPVRSGQ